MTYVVLHSDKLIKWISIPSDKKNFVLIFPLAIFNVVFIILFASSYKSTFLSVITMLEDIDFTSPSLNLTKTKSK
jgi:hypothetical protein